MLSFYLGDVLFGTIAIAVVVFGVVEVLLRGRPAVPASEMSEDASAERVRTSKVEIEGPGRRGFGGTVGAFWYGTLTTIGAIGVPLALFEREYWWALLAAVVALGAGGEMFRGTRRRSPNHR